MSFHLRLNLPAEATRPSDWSADLFDHKRWGRREFMVRIPVHLVVADRDKEMYHDM